MADQQLAARLAGDLAPQTGPNGEALANLKATLKILNENDENR